MVGRRSQQLLASPDCPEPLQLQAATTHLLVLLLHHLLKDGWQGVDHVLGDSNSELGVVQDVLVLKLQHGQNQPGVSVSVHLSFGSMRSSASHRIRLASMLAAACRPSSSTMSHGVEPTPADCSRTATTDDAYPDQVINDDRDAA